MPSAPGEGAEEAAMTRKEAAAAASVPKRAERESAMSRPFERAVDPAIRRTRQTLRSPVRSCTWLYQFVMRNSVTGS
ncbi:hypothetical protein GCM10010448_43440 [Streptomyces glomeratus]|uniref:Uncharacterized protein n=1 Tax=Streptomyces glomeratus TaxID=284452 RepID=A0ABP6LSX0_9ACTN